MKEKFLEEESWKRKGEKEKRGKGDD